MNFKKPEELKWILLIFRFLDLDFQQIEKVDKPILITQVYSVLSEYEK